MTTIPTQRIYEGYLLSGDRRVFFVRHFGTFCNVGCSVGFHVDTNVVCDMQHIYESMLRFNINYLWEGPGLCFNRLTPNGTHMRQLFKRAS